MREHLLRIAFRPRSNADNNPLKKPFYPIFCLKIKADCFKSKVLLRMFVSM